MLGGDGNDTINGAGGDDRIWGDAGNDSLIGGIGNDTLWGGSGADVFVFATGHGSDMIADFEDGNDQVRIASGAADFSAITITSQGVDTLLQFSDVSILLSNVDAAAIGPGDFIFG